MPSIEDQLRPLVEEWARRVTEVAAHAQFDATQALCPVGTSESGGATGTMRDSATLDGDATRWHIEYQDVGYTDEGPEPHDIHGNPLLAFPWHERGIPLMIARSVHWVPGAGVEQNRGWFTNNVTDATWDEHLRFAADSTALGDG